MLPRPRCRCGTVVWLRPAFRQRLKVHDAGRDAIERVACPHRHGRTIVRSSFVFEVARSSRADLWIVGSEPEPEPEREESAALAARTYGEAAEGVTIAVTDDLFPANDGVWHVDAKGAVHDEIEPAGADLATDVATLAATYLSGVRWSALADVGRVEVRNDSALAPADTLFLHSPAPFCGSAF
jgi:Sterol carrier protein domain